MVYKEHLTKFFQLQPLKTKGSEEIAYHLFQILLTQCAPTILRLDNDRNSVIESYPNYTLSGKMLR